MDHIGVAIAGTGFMGRVHAEALRRIGIDVVGIAGSTRAKSNAAAEELGIPRAYESYDQLLEDRQVSAVHVATPNNLHFDMVQRALETGRHVLCEKPLAMNSEETAELCRLSSLHPELAAGINYNVRFYPMCREIREQIRSGKSGRLIHVGGVYVQDWLLKETDYNWRVTERGGQLRAVTDIGTHWLDLVWSMTGLEVESVLADLATVHARRQRPTEEVETFLSAVDAAPVQTRPVHVSSEDLGNILLRFRGGTRGNLHVSQVCSGRKNCLRLEIQGLHQSHAWDSERPNELWIGHRERSNELLLKDPTLLSPDAAALAAYPAGHNEGYDDSFKQCFTAFYNFIRNGLSGTVPEFATFADGHRDAVLCEAIQQSAREQRWIALPGNNID